MVTDERVDHGETAAKVIAVHGAVRHRRAADAQRAGRPGPDVLSAAPNGPGTKHKSFERRQFKHEHAHKKQ